MDASYIGTIKRGELFRHVEHGYLILVEGHEVLLPFEDTDFYTTDDEMMEVFLYADGKGNILATAKLPTATKDQAGLAKVSQVIASQGVLIDLGLPQDILIPKAYLADSLSDWPQVGEELKVKLDTSPENKLFALPLAKNEAAI